jgi:hypothetical protein
MTITITNTSLEFTKLGSFGTALGFGQNLVNSMDTSFYARARGGATNPDVQVRLALGSGWGLAKGARCGVGEGDRGPWLGARQRAVRPARPVASPTSPLPRRQIAKLVDANERNDMYWVGAGRRLRVWVPVGWGQGQRRTVGSAACAAAAAPAPGPGHAARPPRRPGGVHGAQARAGGAAAPPAVNGGAGLQRPLQPPHHGGGPGLVDQGGSHEGGRRGRLLEDCCAPLDAATPAHTPSPTTPTHPLPTHTTR